MTVNFGLIVFVYVNVYVPPNWLISVVLLNTILILLQE